MILTPSPPLTTSHTSTPPSNLVLTIFSDNKSIMVAAIIFLVLVILFVLLLHVYARWFLLQARRRSARRSVTLPQVIGARVHQQIRSSFTVDTIFIDEIATKGLDSSDISLIPLFVYKVDEHKMNGLECAICLSFFEEEEMGRKLPLCGHSFHVECIDMWLHSHATCPVCRGDIAIRLDNLDTSLNVVDTNRDMSDEVVVISSSSDQDTIIEIVGDVPNPEDDNVSRRDSSTMCLLSCPSMSSSSQFDRDSLKKIVGRSRSERKVHPSMDLH